MKRALLLLSALCLLCLLAGCNDNKKEEPANTATDTPVPAKEEQQMTEQPTPTTTNTPTPTPALTDENGMYFKCPAEYLTKRDGNEHRRILNGRPRDFIYAYASSGAI